METETKTEGEADTTNGKEEGAEADVVTLKKDEYEKLNQTLGSLKRELKDLKKPKEETRETSKETKPDEHLLQKFEKLSMRSAGLTHQDDMELARTTAKKWNMDVDDVLADEDFKVKLEKQQTARANADASTNIRGGGGEGQAKNTEAYWVAKGTPPSAQDVPDRKTRVKIARAFMKNARTSGKTFYND